MQISDFLSLFLLAKKKIQITDTIVDLDENFFDFDKSVSSVM
jgi:hypothetical protein